MTSSSESPRFLRNTHKIFVGEKVSHSRACISGAHTHRRTDKWRSEIPSDIRPSEFVIGRTSRRGQPENVALSLSYIPMVCIRCTNLRGW